jgi:SAM-dependent methyltransferase
MTRERARPRPWHTDWLLLRGLSRLVAEQAAARMLAGQTLVDMGCGDMPYRRLIEDSGIAYKGADIDSGADLRIGSDGRIDLPDDSADAVLSVQVLEHVLDLDAYCGEIRRLLHPDGTLFLSTHGTWLYHPHPEDHRRWTRTGLVVDLESRGFKVEETRALVGPLATTTLLRLTGYAFVLRKLPVVGAFCAGALSVLMNARALLEDAITPANMRFDNACVYWVRARAA